jgi:hypothetical protein
MVRYILQRSDGLRLGKDSLWTAECTNNLLYQSEHQDIVLNKLIELNAKDINLRAKVTSIDLDSFDNSETVA